MQVLIDWGDNGTFLAVDEDVTADVQLLTLTHVRDYQTEYMNGGVLELTLTNGDHKYSPSKGTITGLKPGRAVWVRMWYPADDFNGVAGEQLAARTVNYDSDWSWTEDIQNFDQDGVGEGAAQTDSTQGNGDCVATLEFNDADVTISANFTRGTDTTDHGGLCIRYVDSSNYAYVRVDGTNLDLRKVIAGVDSSVATAGHSWSTSTTKFLVVALHGTNVRVYVDNVERMDTTLSDAAIDAGTKHGLFSDDEANHKWLDFGGFRSLFYGQVAKIRPRPRSGAEYCYVQCVDTFDQFKKHIPWSYNSNDTSPTAHINEDLGKILDSIGHGIGTTKRQFDNGRLLAADVDHATEALNVGRKGTDDDMLTLIYRYQDEEDGFIYMDGYGFLVAEDRNHRGATPHTVSKATLKDTYDGTNPGFEDLAWDDGTEGIENIIHATVTRGLVSAPNTVLWTSEQAKDTAVSISFNASEAKDLIMEFKDHDVTWRYTALTATTDYTANTASDGSGTDLTSQLTVAVVDGPQFSGKRRKVRVTFGGTSGFLTKLQLRGHGLTLEDGTDIEDEDTTSQSDYGERKKTINCLWIDRDAVARTLVTNRLARRKDPKTLVEVTFNGHDKPTLRHQIARRLSDRMTVSHSDMGISEDFFYEGEDWEISRGAYKIKHTMHLRGV